MTLSGSVEVITDGYTLSVSKALEAPHIIFELPKPPPRNPNDPVLACTTGNIRLIDKIGDQYILFSASNLIWIYGVVENRKGLLSSSPAAHLLRW
ncbi:hypothetical protein [Ferrovibrio sp.]|uniref:hypothetical protein n=1 Tax=Ferrovibrio sp. TaxID=1917215 RepID=UPI0039198F78